MRASTEPNNFTLLRLMFASFVVIGHYFWLGTPTAVLEATDPFPLSDFGVEAFFVTSGYLVTASFAREPVITAFYVKRLLRLYPLYLAVILLQALVLAGLAASHDSFSWGSLASYVGWNAVFANFMAPSLGGLFDALVNPAINPSLWTLKLEIIFYLCVPFLHALHQRFGTRFLVIVFLASSLWYLGLTGSNPILARQFPGQLRCFIVGMAIFYSGRSTWPFAAGAGRAWLIALLALALALLVKKSGVTALTALLPLMVATFVANAALGVPALLRRVPDLSYGLYLFHGPLVQVSMLGGLYTGNLAGLAATMALALVLAVAGRELVENPGIAFGSRLARRLVAAQQASAAHTGLWSRPFPSLAPERAFVPAPESQEKTKVEELNS